MAWELIIAVLKGQHLAKKDGYSVRHASGFWLMGASSLLLLAVVCWRTLLRVCADTSILEQGKPAPDPAYRRTRVSSSVSDHTV
jgi:hypothetical protein